MWAFPASAIWPFERKEEPPVAAASDPSSPAALLSRAVQIPTVNPPGDERPLAELFVDELARAGIETRLIETPALDGESKSGRAAA